MIGLRFKVVGFSYHWSAVAYNPSTNAWSELNGET